MSTVSNRPTLPTSRYRPRRASSRRATGKPNALDVERPGAPLLPSTSATTLDEPPAFLVADEPPPTSFSALDVERFGGLQRPSTSAPPSSTSSHRRTPAPSSTEFQAKGKPLRSGPKGLRMGPVPVPETRYQCRSRGCQDDTGPETSFGRGELTDRCRWRSLHREGPPNASPSHRRNSPEC